MFHDVPNKDTYLKAKGGCFPSKKVTEEELITLMTAAGYAAGKIELQLKLMKVLGSSILIGDRMYGLKKEE